MCEGDPSLGGLRLLLEDVVDQNLEDNQENDDDVVALLEEGAALHPGHGATPQHGDAPANTHTRAHTHRPSSLRAQRRSITSHRWHRLIRRLSHLLMSSCVCFIDSMAL